MSRSVYKGEDGKWRQKRDDASKGSVHDTQADAINRAREQLRKEGGGELNIHGRDGRIRQKDTVPSGHDPYPPKG